MNKLVLFFNLFVFWLPLSAQSDIDSTDQKWTDNLYIGIASNRLALFEEVHNLSALVAYQINDGSILEYEIGVFNFNESSKFNRIVIKFLGHNNDFWGVGFQYYNRVKTENGIFSRFNESYRQQMDYKTDSSFQRLFFVAGRSAKISEKIQIGLSSSVGIGTKTSTYKDHPEDAIFINNGNVFSRDPQGKKLNIDIGFKLFSLYSF